MFSQDPFQPDHPIDAFVARGVRFAQRVAIAFGLALVGGIVIGAVATDSALAQIFVTIVAAIALWIPMLALTLRVGKGRKARPQSARGATVDATARPVQDHADPWRRLAIAAPHEAERISALKNSIGRSRTSLGAANLDPDAHDLCVLIDRRLPDLIDRNLDTLPPDDRGRKAQVAELIDLVEQFARHCGRKRDGHDEGREREAEILRRRFADRLGGDSPF